MSEKLDIPGYVYNLVRHMRPDIWIASAIMFYIGWAVAARNVLPTVESLLGLILMGPMLGGSVLLLNEYWDLEADRFNPRKRSYSAIINGKLDPSAVFKLGSILMLLAASFSLIISLSFFTIICSCIVLSLIYSNPKIKLKSKPGLDLGLNMLGLGFLCPLAGWILERPFSEAPILYFMLTCLAIGELYVLFLLLDYWSDHAAGIQTLVVRLGFRNGLILGAALVTLTSSYNLILAWMNYIHTPEICLRVLPTVLMPPVIYGWFMRDPIHDNIITCLLVLSAIRLLGWGLFILYFSSIWVI